MLCLRTLLVLAGLTLSAAAENLIVNGNFENGTNYFTSDYARVSGNLNLFNEGSFDVVRSPHDAHDHGADFTDHTGRGFMVVANGSADSGKAIWRQTVMVRPHQEYALSGWSASWGRDWNLAADVIGEDPCPPQLRISINGVDCGNIIQVPAANGQWKFFARVWNSGAATSAKIEIHLATTDSYGNDLALDDLEFSLGGSVQTPTQRDLSASSGAVAANLSSAAASASTVFASTNSVAGVQIYRAVEIAWPTVANQVYQVQSCSDLTTPDWIDFNGPVFGNGTTNVVFDTVNVQSSRFYRVLTFQ